MLTEEEEENSGRRRLLVGSGEPEVLRGVRDQERLVILLQWVGSEERDGSAVLPLAQALGDTLHPVGQEPGRTAWFGVGAGEGQAAERIRHSPP